MRSTQLTFALALATSALTFAGCGSDGPDPIDLTSIMTTDDGDISVELLAEADLTVGRNLVWYRVTNKSDGSPITDATVTQDPIMDMMDFSHSCPEVDPSAADSNGLYPGKIVFIMPSGEGTWKNTVTVVRSGETTEHPITLEAITVADTDYRKTFEYAEGADTVRAFVTLNNSAPWTSGDNPYILTVNYRQTMMSFPALTDVSVAVTVTPQGGAAVTSSAPVHEVDGEYLGSIALPQAGTYTVTFVISRGTTELGTLSWERTI